MNFALKPYHRNVSSDALIADLRRVASILKKTAVTKQEQDRFGNYNSSTFRRNFGTWTETLRQAGLDQTRSRLGISDVELLNDIKNVAHILKKRSVTLVEQGNYGQYNSTSVRRFKNWRKALDLAGLESSCTLPYTSKEDLLVNLEEVWTALGRQPVFDDMIKPKSRYAAGTYARHFGSWRKSLEAFVVSTQIDVDSMESHLSKLAMESEAQAVSNEAGMLERDKRHIGWRLRFLVMRRDYFKCKACGRSPSTDRSTTLVVDHVVAWAKGGRTAFDNLQTLCTECNIGKSDLDYTEDEPDLSFARSTT